MGVEWINKTGKTFRRSMGRGYDSLKSTYLFDAGVSPIERSFRAKLCEGYVPLADAEVIVRVSPQGDDDHGRPGALAFHGLFVSARDYRRAGADPFAFVPWLRDDWNDATPELRSERLMIAPTPVDLNPTAEANSQTVRDRGGVIQDNVRGNKEGVRFVPPPELRAGFEGYKNSLARPRAAGTGSGRRPSAAPGVGVGAGQGSGGR